MTADYDATEPLQLLMEEWNQVGRWFWVFLAAAGVTMLTGYPWVSLLLVAAGLGNALLRLGSTVIVAANELRKELRLKTDDRMPKDEVQSPER